MKKGLKMMVIALLGSTLALPSCKYDEGPAISLRSKEERVANTWKVEKAYENGSDVTSDYDQYELQLLSGGSAKLVAIYKSGSIGFEYETSGFWSLENKKEDLRLDFEDNGADRIYHILKLKEKEMWLKEKGETVELHLVPR